MAVDLETLANELSGLTVMEAAELAKMLEEKWGVSAQPTTIGALPPQLVDAEPEQAQTEFTVTLTDIGPTKVQVVKEIRAATGLDLKAAMAMADPAGLPRLIKDNVSRTDADAIKAKIEAVGGVIEIT